MPVPPPKQPPCTSATVGTGSALSRSTASAVARLTRTFSSREARAPRDPREVGPGLEVPAVAPQHDHAQPGACAERIHGRQQALDHVAVVGVVHLGTVERDGGDATLIEAVQYGGAAHVLVS